jgi:2-dehydro-3-deoxyphosphogalactonate aldolase
MTFFNRIAAMPLVAILRGLEPAEAVEIGEALVEAGFRCLEVPLNSPEPYESIRRLKAALGDQALIGAGTVLDVHAVSHVKDAGGELIISPNADRAVIDAATAHGMVSIPAFFTPTEAFAAIAAGAHGLKLFPAEGSSPAMLKAMRAVLPKDMPIFVVGGVTPDNMAPWLAAGANGFGIGSSLYKPGVSAREVATHARSFVSAWKRLTASKAHPAQ